MPKKTRAFWQRGAALPIVLLTLVVVGGISVLLFYRAFSELRHSAQDQGVVQTLLLARGGAGATGIFLANQARDKLGQIVNQTASTTDCWAYGGNVNCVSGGSPDPVATAQALANVASQLQSYVDGALCNVNMAPRNIGASVQSRIYFTSQACGQPLPQGVELPPGRFVTGDPRSTSAAATQTYALPFVLVSTASLNPYKRNIVLQGEYRFTLGRESFARYALFTNIHTMSNGSPIWFTGQTLFDGPVHTNGNFRFSGKPWFGGEVTSAGCSQPGSSGCNGQIQPGAYFYSRGFVSANAMTPSPSQPVYGPDAPQFTAGVDWRKEFVPMPQNNQNQRQAAQQGGLYYSYDLKSLRLSCRYVIPGSPEQVLPCSGTPPAGAVKYQYIEVTACQNSSCSSTRSETYRYAEGGLLYSYQNGAWGNPRSFNGVIFSEGKVQSLSGPGRTNSNDPATAPPSLAEFAQITVAAGDDVYITGDLKYEVPPCSGTPTRNPDGTVTGATCDKLNARNVLGVFSQGGDIFLGSPSVNPLPNLTLHATLMSATGVVQVYNYDQISPRGSVYLLGGIIEYYYGAFGTFDPSTGQNRTGYGRAFTYDRRFLRGLAPPFFPTTGQDGVKSVSLFSYGQREQLY